MLKRYSKTPTVSFTSKVYKIVSKIPKGKVLTYKQVAYLAGSPKASRAVGRALNKNPDLKLVPCHRVVKANYQVGGYRYGTDKKIALLRKEGVVIKKGKVFTALEL